MEIGPEFWEGLLKIIGVNIVLSGDNAVVIALASRSLPPHMRSKAIWLGAGGALAATAADRLIAASIAPKSGWPTTEQKGRLKT